MRRPRRSLLLLTASCVTAIGLAYGFARHQERVARELYARPALGASATAESADFVASELARRRADMARAAAALGGLLYVLGLGALLGPRPMRLLSGNLIVLIGLFLLLESGFRVAGVHFPRLPRAGAAGDRGLWVYDARKGWFHAPGSRAVSFLGGPDRGAVRINALGLRGPEIREPAPPGHVRVLVSGDSYVFGVGVDEEHLLTAQLERLLGEALGTEVEVVNLGVTGYSTDQEYLLLEELAPRLGPELVVLVVCDNDYVGNTEDFAWRRYYKPYFDVDDGGRLFLRNVPVPELTRRQRLKLWLGQESRVWNLFRSRESDQPAVAALLEALQVDVPRKPRRPFKTTAAIVGKLAGLVESRGARLLVVNTGRRGENPQAFEILSRSLRSAGIPHFDMIPVLERARQAHPAGHWEFPRDMHWNRDAHAVAAEAVFAHVAEHRLLEGLEPPPP